MADDAAAPKSVNKIVSDAVRLGYKVIEDQILQGRQAAEHFRSGAYSNSHAEEDVKKMMDRIMYLAKEMGVVGFDLTSAMLRGTRSPSGAGSQSDIAIQVHSKKRIELNHYLSSAAAHFEPTIPSLNHTVNQTVAPLNKIRFEAKHDRPLLVVEVPESQPAGTYTGVIMDAKSQQARGYISVTVLD
jgi:hypothetical protein